MVQAIKRDEVYIDPEGIYVETQQPERRSRKPPLLLVHGALTGSWLWSSFGAYFAERGWEAHAMNLRGHYTSDLADLAETRMRDYATDIGVAIRQLGRPPIVIGWDSAPWRPCCMRSTIACWDSSCWPRRRRRRRCRDVRSSTS